MTLDSSDIEVLQLLAEVCRQRSVDWMLVGALARDVHLLSAGVPPGRATSDVDVAVIVRSWAAFDELKTALVETGQFVKMTMAQRLRGKGALDGRQLDIVPFGDGIKDEDSMIRWPPDAAIVMSVAGFDETFESSITCTLDGLEVRVASAAGLGILKLIAWRDRRGETSKDAVDFEKLLRSYEYIVGPDRLYGPDFETLERSGFEPCPAAAWLLGSDMRTIASPSTLTALRATMSSGILADMPGSFDDDGSLTRLYSQCQAGLNAEPLLEN
jgi:predicted nucleotidyltransferase